MPKLDAAAVQQLIYAAMPSSADTQFRVQAVTDTSASILLPYQSWMLRPGGTLSGPAIMTAADVAMYALVLAHFGPELLAVTSDLNIRFLAKPKAEDLVADVTFLQRGRRLIVMQCTVRNVSDPNPVAHITGSYMRPDAGT